HLYSPSFPTRRSSDLPHTQLIRDTDVRAEVDNELSFILIKQVIQPVVQANTVHASFEAGDKQNRSNSNRNQRQNQKEIFECPPEDRKSTRLNSSHVSI